MNQAQETLAPVATTEAETVEVLDLNMFAKLLIGWHRRKVKMLEHFLQMPEGQIMQVGDEPELVITGDTHKGFVLGMNLALMEFGTLPFSFETEDADVRAPAEPTANAGQ